VLCGPVTDVILQRFVLKSDKDEKVCQQVYSDFLSVCEHLVKSIEGEDSSAYDASLFSFDAVFDVLCKSSIVLGNSEASRLIAAKSLNLCLATSNPDRSRAFVCARVGCLTGATPCSPSFREQVSRLACSILFNGGENAEFIYSMLGNAFIGREAKESSGFDKEETKKFVSFAVTRLLQGGLPNHERNLMLLCTLNVLRKSKAGDVLVCVFDDIINAKKPSAGVSVKEGRRIMAHPVFSLKIPFSSVLSSVIQQFLVCRGFMDDIFQRDLSTVSQKRRPIVSAFQQLVQGCINGFDGFQVSSERLVEVMDEYVDASQTSLTTPADVWAAFSKIFALRETSTEKKPSLRIRSEIIHTKSGVTSACYVPVFKVKKGSSFETAIRASKPQLFSSGDSSIQHAVNYADQIMFNLTDSYRVGSGCFVPMVQIPKSMTLGNNKKYTLTGFIITPVGVNRKFISCVRTFRACHSDPSKNWAICGADDGRVIHVSQCFVDQYLNGSLTLWNRAPIRYVVYTALDAEDEELLDVNKVSVDDTACSCSNIRQTIDERERQLLMLLLLDNQDVKSCIISEFPGMRDLLFSYYNQALEQHSELAEVWSVLMNDMLANSSSFSDAFLGYQIKDGESFPNLSQLSQILLQCTSEKMRILYEESVCVAMRRLEPEQKAKLSEFGFGVVTDFGTVQQRFAGCNMFGVTLCAYRLLDVARSDWPRFKQYFKLLLDIARLSPEMQQILLGLDIGFVFNFWFVNKKTLIGDFEAFVSDEVLPDLTEFMQILQFLVTSELVRCHRSEPSVIRFLNGVFDPDFFEKLMTYPYCPSVIDSMITEFCLENFDNSMRMWKVMLNVLRENRKADEQRQLKDHILHFICGISDGLSYRRLASVLGVEGCSVQNSLVSFWTFKPVDGMPGLAWALLFSSLCKIAPIRELILKNIRRFLWIEYTARVVAASKYGRDFNTAHRVKDDDYIFDRRDEDIYAIAVPEEIKTYVAIRSACQFLTQSYQSQQVIPVLTTEDDDKYNQLLSTFRSTLDELSEQNWHSSVQPSSSSVSSAAAPSAVIASEHRSQSSSTNKSSDDEKFEQVKALLGDGFSDDQIRRAIKYCYSVDDAVCALFDGRY